jgi:hypothetical protein
VILQICVNAIHLKVSIFHEISANYALTVEQFHRAIKAELHYVSVVMVESASTTHLLNMPAIPPNVL